MTTFDLNETLPVYEVTANNFAEEAENKIHNSDVAPRFGFKGGLVPGVGDHAYMTHPIVQALGREWLERGAMEVKFLKPVYHGELTKVTAQVASIDPLEFKIELLNSEQTLCAVGTAGLPDTPSAMAPEDFPEAPVPEREERREPRAEALPAGLVLGSLRERFNLVETERKQAEEFVENLPIYLGPEAVCHPSILLQLANEILIRNVALGPWIHTASRCLHFGLPVDGEWLSVRAKILDSVQKRGHEITSFDVGIFGANDRPILRVRHEAIVRLRGSKS
jgi:hypothetical protein